MPPRAFSTGAREQSHPEHEGNRNPKSLGGQAVSLSATAQEVGASLPGKARPSLPNPGCSPWLRRSGLDGSPLPCPPSTHSSCCPDVCWALPPSGRLQASSAGALGLGRYSPARSRITWSSSGSSEKWGTLLAHSTSVNSCLSAAWQMFVTGSLGCREKRPRSVRAVRARAALPSPQAPSLAQGRAAPQPPLPAPLRAEGEAAPGLPSSQAARSCCLEARQTSKGTRVCVQGAAPNSRGPQAGRRQQRAEGKEGETDMRPLRRRVPAPKKPLR